jgi:two-component system response regulator ResD
MFGANNASMAASNGRVLVVDDEPIVREILERYLHRGGFDVATASDGQAALDSFEANEPDLIVLDLMLPGIDGLEVFRRIRKRRRGTGVIMLTARGGETDRVVGLDLGADDYVAKPFSPREIVARARAVLRRARGDGAAGTKRELLRIGALEIDLSAREVTSDGRPVELTPKEFDLLSFLATNPRTVFSRTQLLEEVWDIAYAGDPSTVTVHVRRLRDKIERERSEPRHLLTVWGVGYRLEP